MPDGDNYFLPSDSHHYNLRVFMGYHSLTTKQVDVQHLIFKMIGVKLLGPSNDTVQ